MNRPLLIALFFPLTANAHQVIGIADGDTIAVRCGSSEVMRVRLSSIDAPEKGQPFGQRSRQSLSDLCFGKDAQLQIRDKDRYGRTVARVICDGVDANRAQVERGMAWNYTRYSRDPELVTVQEQAKAAGRGLWADREPVPPWEWRREKNNLRGKD
jgi:micrococcal nuclease